MPEPHPYLFIRDVLAPVVPKLRRALFGPDAKPEEVVRLFWEQTGRMLNLSAAPSPSISATGEVSEPDGITIYPGDAITVTVPDGEIAPNTRAIAITMPEPKEPVDSFFVVLTETSEWRFPWFGKRRRYGLFTLEKSMEMSAELMHATSGDGKSAEEMTDEERQQAELVKALSRQLHGDHMFCGWAVGDPEPAHYNYGGYLGETDINAFVARVGEHLARNPK